MTQLVRDRIEDLIGHTHAPHPGLLLTRGLTHWPGEGEGGGKAKKALIDQVARQSAGKFYLAALERWKRVTSEQARFASFEAELAGRLYIGASHENALEAGVTTAHAYGMPIIPGSAIKGLCRATAKRIKIGEEARLWIFGSDVESGGDGEAGGLVFHDAWWVGKAEDRPFVSEIVTPHHQQYYGSQGETPATDFDSPIPAYQIAINGAFHFAIEGDRDWTGVAKRLLQIALGDAGTGIGGKRSSGYGFFKTNLNTTSKA